MKIIIPKQQLDCIFFFNIFGARKALFFRTLLIELLLRANTHSIAGVNVDI